MAALATIADLEARLGRTFTTAEEARATTLLEDASASVRAYTRQTISEASHTVTIRPPASGRVPLWESPVSSITTVLDLDDDAVPFVDYSDLGFVQVSTCDPTVVTYVAGYDPVPPDVVAVVCAMAGRAFGVTPEQSAFTQEQTGPFARSIGSAAASGALGMLPNERAILDLYRPARSLAGNIGLTPWIW